MFSSTHSDIVFFSSNTGFPWAMAWSYLQYIPADDDSGSVLSQLIHELHEVGGVARSIDHIDHISRISL